MRTKDQTAKLLADAHFRLDEGIARIFRIVEPDEGNSLKPIKLLEINPMTAEVGISPVGLSADPERGICYPTSSVRTRLSRSICRPLSSCRSPQNCEYPWIGADGGVTAPADHKFEFSILYERAGVTLLKIIREMAVE